MDHLAEYDTRAVLRLCARHLLEKEKKKNYQLNVSSVDEYSGLLAAALVQRSHSTLILLYSDAGGKKVESKLRTKGIASMPYGIYSSLRYFITEFRIRHFLWKRAGISPSCRNIGFSLLSRGRRIDSLYVQYLFSARAIYTNVIFPFYY